MFVLRHINNWSYYCMPELEERGMVHGFFTKESSAPGLLKDGRNAFLDLFSIKDAVIMDQEHGDEIHIIRNGERPLRGDGVILVERDVAGIIKTADCLAIIVVEPNYPMAAIVHAGWRGTAKKIASKAVEKMVNLGAQREKMTALFGPSIRSCCYEIGEEVYDVFKNKDFSDGVFKRKKNSIHLDLIQANTEVLLKVGIERIYDTRLCTFCAGGIFASYRRGERSVRQINFVSLKG